MEEVGVERIVTATLEELGISVAAARTILIREGYFVGHKFRFEGGYAIQLAGRKVIEFYDDNGGPLKTVAMTDRSDVPRAAS